MASIDLGKILGLTGPVTFAEGHFKITVDPSTLKAELSIDDEKLGPVSLAPAKFDLEVGSLFVAAEHGVSGLIEKVTGAAKKSAGG